MIKISDGENIEKWNDLKKIWSDRYGDEQSCSFVLNVVEKETEGGESDNEDSMKETAQRNTEEEDNKREDNSKKNNKSKDKKSESGNRVTDDNNNDDKKNEAVKKCLKMKVLVNMKVEIRIKLMCGLISLKIFKNTYKKCTL
ncbi:hypothetical protein RFI_32270 [Reticulomyxa filosa]|uniref:Uncharacterized protein n=1 Tax=Reticulomyxa filosa TaxID=46433 RepID=X6LUR1_RETFI|nr:hypothetical protein RFI_32270 [Reticulomyxa filosa]|eukprot:ETO05126.1 hypothetical protein RFI_32270 [Reticulomyxa filosa]